MHDLAPGFASALDAQVCFRAILDAFSAPGRIVRLPVSLSPPSGLSAASAAVLLTLADAHVKVAFPEDAAARSWLNFHTGAPVTTVAEADFCVCAATDRPALSTLRQGTDEAPEAGATLILEVDDLDGPAFRLSGPGLEHEAIIPLPLDASFLSEWQTQTHNAPCGVDIILCAGDRIIALPRSIRIEKG